MSMHSFIFSLILVLSCIVGIDARSSRVARSARKRQSKQAASGGSKGTDLTGATAIGEAAVLMKLDRHWIIPPLDREAIRTSPLTSANRNLAEYVGEVLSSSPLVVHLDSKPVQIKSTSDGEATTAASAVRKYKATVTLGSHIHHKPFFLTSRPKSLRAVWSSAPPSSVQETSRDLVTKSYEECSAGFRNLLQLEVILPKTSLVSSSPVILYTFPMEAGSMNKASRLALTRGLVQVLPKGRKHSSSSGQHLSEAVDIGITSLHLHSGPSLIDWTWAKGRVIFWKGRPVGQV